MKKLKPTIVFEGRPVPNGYIVRVVATPDDELNSRRTLLIAEVRECDAMGVVRWATLPLNDPRRIGALEAAVLKLADTIGMLNVDDDEDASEEAP